MADDLFAISLSGDEGEDTTGQPDGAAKPKSREEKLKQSEEAFQALKASYQPKVENGNIHAKISLPLPTPAPKMQVHELLHAVEELYFHRRYADAAAFASRALASAAGGSGGGALDPDTAAALAVYRDKCELRAG